jgi:hypothetical protein
MQALVSDLVKTIVQLLHLSTTFNTTGAQYTHHAGRAVEDCRISNRCKVPCTLCLAASLQKSLLTGASWLFL